MRVAEVEPRRLLEHEGRVGGEVAALDAVRREKEVRVEQHLVGAVRAERPPVTGGCLRVGAGTGSERRDGEERDTQGGASCDPSPQKVVKVHDADEPFLLVEHRRRHDAELLHAVRDRAGELADMGDFGLSRHDCVNWRRQ